MGKVIKIIVVLIVIVFLWRFVYPLFLSDEERIEKIVRRTAEKTEKRSGFTFMEHFDRSFKDDSGLRYDDIKAMGFRIFQMYKELDVEYSINNLQIDENKAKLKLELSITVIEQGTLVDLIHGTRKTNDFVIELEKKEGDWVFISSEKP